MKRDDNLLAGSVWTREGYRARCLSDQWQDSGTPLNPSLDPPVLTEHNQQAWACPSVVDHSPVGRRPYLVTGFGGDRHTEIILPRVVENPTNFVTRCPTIWALQDYNLRCSHWYPTLPRLDFLPSAPRCGWDSHIRLESHHLPDTRCHRTSVQGGRRQ